MKTLVVFATALVLSGAAQAQEICEAPAQVCAARLQGGCLTRLGAGVLAADADASCESQFSAYRDCLSDVALRCGAAVENALGSENASEIGAGIRAGEIDDIPWLLAVDLAELRVADGNEPLTQATAALDNRLVFLDLSIDVAGAAFRETGYDPSIETECVKDPEVHDITYGWYNGNDGKFFLPTSYLSEGKCKGMVSSWGGGFAITGDEDAYDLEQIGCGTECAYSHLVGFFSVSVADSPREFMGWADNKSQMSPKIELEPYKADALLRNKFVKAVDQAREN